MRPVHYHLKASLKQANKAQAAIADFAIDLGRPRPAPVPRMTKFVLGFDSGSIAYGDDLGSNVDDKIEVSFGIAKEFGLTEGLTPHELQFVFFNEHISEDVVKALRFAMLCVADMEANGKNEGNMRLLVQEVATLYSLFNEGVRLLHTL
jgi:hypothetical protein